MRTKQPAPPDIDAYIAAFPAEIRKRLESVRATIRKAAPDAREKISYQIPTFALCGNLVHFAAFQRHIGFYPGAAAIKEFARDLARYDSAKGSVQFPHDTPVPFGLIRKIVKFRVKQNLAKDASRRPPRKRLSEKRKKKG